MIIVEKPYASEFLIDTILQNDFPVLENEAILEAEIEEGAMNLISSDVAVEFYQKQEYPLIYANSENAISWVLDNLPQSNLSRYINLFKNKKVFRETIQEFYPNFSFKSVSLDELTKMRPKELKYPFVIKPAVGFLSFGVHTVNDADDFKFAMSALNKEMKMAQSMYPDNVINSSEFLIEDMIQGEEYAIDAYYDRNGIPVILNIFQHPFLDNNDVKDRIYLMSTEIMIKYMAKFSVLLMKIGQKHDIRNFPFHMEVRVTENDEIIPIEVNPMRFAGWCTTDVAKYAWGINVYECFYHQQRPDWNEVLSKKTGGVYYFSMIEVPADVNPQSIKSFDYKSFLGHYSNILELRKINPKCNPLFAIVFGHTNSKSEVRDILSLKTKSYID